MGQVYLGIIDGYAKDSEYGQYKLYLKYSSCTRAKDGFSKSVTLSEAYIYAERARNYRWTTNTIYLDSVEVAGKSLKTGSWKGYNSDTGNSRESYSTSKKTIKFTVDLDDTSVSISVTGHRSGQESGAQTFSKSLTVPTGYGTGEGPEVSISSGINSATITVSGGKGGTNNADTGNRHIYYTLNNTEASSSNGSGVNLGKKRTYTVSDIGGEELRVRAYTITKQGNNPGSDEASESIPLYTALSKPTKPTVVSSQNKNTPKATYTAEWSGGNTTNTATRKHYLVQIQKNGVDYEFTTTEQSYSFTASDIGGLVPKDTIQVRVKAISNTSGFNSSWSSKSTTITVNSAGIVNILIPGIGWREGQLYVKDSAGAWHEATSDYVNSSAGWKEST